MFYDERCILLVLNPLSASHVGLADNPFATSSRSEPLFAIQTLQSLLLDCFFG
jgi:hypothetical protein